MARWYVAEGFVVVARNWTVRGGELDVVARSGRLIAVCEVKARATDAFGSPAEALTPLKQRRVRRAGFSFVGTLPEPGSWRVRFDLACVLGTSLDMHLDAF